MPQKSLSGVNMPIADKSCENLALLTRRSTGFTYAHWQHDFIDTTPIVLVGADPDGRDLSFAVPWEFVEENHLPGRLGITPENGLKIYLHVSACPFDICKEANDGVGLLSKLMGDRSPIEGVLVAAQFHRGGSLSEPLVLHPDDGWKSAIEALAPIFRLYNGPRRSDFAWPGEGRVRLEGYAKLSFGPGTERISFRTYREERSITVSYADILKVRCADRDVWRNPAIYHVELSHPNEKRFDSGGPVALELREDMDGVEDLAQRVSATLGEEFRRVRK